MSTIAEVIENWETLEFEDRKITLDIITRGLIDSKRDNLIDRIKEAKLNYASGEVRKGSSKDLFREMRNV